MISDENAMISPSTEPVPGFPEEANPRARSSLSPGVANFVWMATTGGRVIHCIPKVEYSRRGSGRFLPKRYRGGHHRSLPPVCSNHAISRRCCGYSVNRKVIGVRGSTQTQVLITLLARDSSMRRPVISAELRCHQDSPWRLGGT